jgi:hypothetical protein
MYKLPFMIEVWDKGSDNFPEQLLGLVRLNLASVPKTLLPKIRG